MNDLSNVENLLFSIEQMLRAVRSQLKSEFKNHNFPVTIDQWIILKNISESNGSNQRDIAVATQKDPAALTRILDILVQKGFVNRTANIEDRRSFVIHLTVDGNRLVNRIMPVAEQVSENALEPLSESTVNEIRIAINKVIANISNT